MKRKFERWIAYTITAMTVISSSMTVSAEELGQGDERGVGEVEGSVETEIYQVILPTNTKGIYDFILDPQGLINKTKAAAYDGKTFEEDSTVFFERSDGEAEVDYSSTSDAITIVNKSSVAVDISLDVKIEESSLGGIVLTEDKEFTDDTSPSFYLALIDGENEIPIGKDGISLDVTVEAAPDGAYEYSYDIESEKYTYKLKKDLHDIQFDEYSFQLTGAANENGKWEEVSDAAPEIAVTWNIVSSVDETLRKTAPDKELNAVLKTTKAGEPADSDKKKTSEEKEVSDSKKELEEKAVSDSNKNPEEKADASDGENEQTASVPSQAPSIAATSYTLTAKKPISIDVDLGSGDAKASKILSVFWKEADQELLNESDLASYKDGKITLSADCVDECLSEENTLPATLIVTFDDVDSTEIEIILEK